MAVLYYHFIIAAAVFSLYLGIYALTAQKYSYLNRSFFRLALIFFAISTTIFFAVTVRTEEESKRILTYLSILWLLFPIIFLKFIIALIEKNDSGLNKTVTYSYVIPLALYIAVISLKSHFTPFDKTLLGWSMRYNTRSPLFFLTALYYVVYITVGLILLHRWGKQNKGSIKQRQANIIKYSTIGISFLLIIYRKLSDDLFSVIPPPFFPVFLTFWLGATAFAIFQFHMMENIPKIVKSNVLSHISDMVLILDLNDRITYINERTENITGFNRKELFNKDVRLLIDKNPDSDMEYVESVLRTKSDTEIPVRISKSFYKDSRGYTLGSILTASDIRIMKTLQKEINRKETVMLKLQESEKKFSRVFNSSPSGLVFFSRKNGSVLEINSKALQIIGYNRVEATGINLFLNHILVNNAENRELIHDLLSNIKISNRNCAIYSKLGEKKTILISVELISISGEPCLLLAGSDITATEEIKTQLLKTQKMESIGILAGGIAHDFNNMLTIINGNISLALSEVQNDDVRDYLLDSLKAGNNATNLTRQLLAFSRGNTAVKDVIDLNEIIKDSVTISLSGKNIIPSLYMDAEETYIFADKNQLQQVFINLIINSVQAMDDNGEITISTTNDWNKKNIIISVTDFGKGIPEKNIEKIFDPFYSTKDTGTGLGLSIVYSIIINHRGNIDVTSTKNEGTTFTISFPLYKRKIKNNTANKNIIYSGEGTIIFMDDDYHIRKVGKSFFESLGFSILTAEKGEDVIDILSDDTRRPQDLKAIILDITVPGGLGGIDTLKLIRKKEKRIPVLLSSGFSNNSYLTDYKKFGFSGAIRKPYEINEIKSVLKSVLI